MRDLVALLLPGGPRFVDELTRAWDDGDAVLPLDPRLPQAALDALLEALAPTVVVDADGSRTLLPGGRPTDDGDALVVATSGSTGAPKGIVHTHDSVAASARLTNAGLGTDPSLDRFVCCMPLNHVAGLSVVTRAMASGTPCEVLASFDAASVERAARERGATLTTLVPTALLRIDPTVFRQIVVGGAAPPERVPSNVRVSYGLTETGSAVAYDGVALPGAELSLDDGEILVRGPMLFRGYRDGRPRPDRDGWFPTGDQGRFDAEGRLEVLGRADDLIITGGENVWPAPIEWALIEHPSVGEAAVVGRPDAEWGQRVTALVVPADAAAPPTLDELRDWVKERFPAHCAPRALEVVDALPRTLLGKVLRREA